MEDTKETDTQQTKQKYNPKWTADMRKYPNRQIILVKSTPSFLTDFLLITGHQIYIIYHYWRLVKISFNLKLILWKHQLCAVKQEFKRQTANSHGSSSIVNPVIVTKTDWHKGRKIKCLNPQSNPFTLCNKSTFLKISEVSISALLPHTDSLIINDRFPMQSPRGHASLIIQTGQRSQTLIMWRGVRGQPAGSHRSRQ